MHLISRPHRSGCVITVTIPDDTTVQGDFVDESTRDITTWLADLALIGYLTPATPPADDTGQRLHAGALTVHPANATIIAHLADPYHLQPVRELDTTELCSLAARGVTNLLSETPSA